MGRFFNKALILVAIGFSSGAMAAEAESGVPKESQEITNQEEAQTPVFKSLVEKSEAPKKSSASLLLRMIASVAIVLILVAAGSLGFKRLTKNKTGSPHKKMIQIMAQHHLAPKKSLCVVRVAGETVLIGITDQNINLIKSLALLDEDLPGENLASKAAFAGTLKEKVDEEFSMEGIRDIVSRKISDLKGPRA